MDQIGTTGRFWLIKYNGHLNASGTETWILSHWCLRDICELRSAARVQTTIRLYYYHFPGFVCYVPHT